MGGDKVPGDGQVSLRTSDDLFQVASEALPANLIRSLCSEVDTVFAHGIGREPVKPWRANGYLPINGLEHGHITTVSE